MPSTSYRTPRGPAEIVSSKMNIVEDLAALQGIKSRIMITLCS
jgi:hypothetical protein